MQNSPEVEFNKFIFQNLLKFAPDRLVSKGPGDGSTKTSYNTSLSDNMFWFAHKPGLVKRLWPITVLIGMLEVLVGLFLLLFVGFYTRDYDKLYHTEDSKMMSFSSFFGCVILIVTGFMLLFALLLERPRSIKFYIFISVLLCVYIFVLACVKIHFSLLVIETDVYNVITQASSYNIFLTKACIIGIATLLGSVIHFIGTVTVFTYYNLKYIQPVC